MLTKNLLKIAKSLKLNGCNWLAKRLAKIASLTFGPLYEKSLAAINQQQSILELETKIRASKNLESLDSDNNVMKTVKALEALGLAARTVNDDIKILIEFNTQWDDANKINELKSALKQIEKKLDILVMKCRNEDLRARWYHIANNIGSLALAI